jgi:hypothetical protein
VTFNAAEVTPRLTFDDNAVTASLCNGIVLHAVICRGAKPAKGAQRQCGQSNASFAIDLADNVLAADSAPT